MFPMTRICLLNPFFLPYQGGTEKHIHEVGMRLVKRGFDVTVLCSRIPGNKKHEVIDGISVKRVDTLLYLDNLPPYCPVPPPVAIAPLMSKAILDECRNQDIFHINNRFFYSPSDTKAINGEEKGLCITLHNARTKGINPTTDFFGNLYDRTNGRQIMADCDHIFGVSQNTLDITVPRKFHSKCSVSYNGVNSAVYSPKVSGEAMRRKYNLENRKVILTVCRLERQKGIQYMLDAVKKLVRHDKSFVWVVLGKGTMLPLLKLAKLDPRYSDNIVVIDEKISELQLSELYSACDAFVLPSIWEPFGMVLCEAMAAEKPVISTTAGGIPEIVTRDTGVLVRPKSAEDLYLAISTMFGNEDKMRRMGKAGRVRVKRYFTWERTADCYEKVYKSLF
jgi:glycosyltransferase involved in cell wall biosynthesis